MPVLTFELRFETKGEVEMVDITEEVRGFVKRSGLSSGLVCIHCPGATGAVTTIEYEDGLLEDFPAMLEAIAPKEKVYQHHLRWHDGNGHSHVRASLMGPSLTIPFVNGEPVLGTWQQIAFVELDNKNRDRKLVIQVMGE